MENEQQETTDRAPDGATALHSKARAGKADHQKRAMSLPKAFRITMAKVADDLCDMAMAVIGVRSESCSVEQLEALLDGDALLMLMDGTARRRGAAIFDAAVVGGLVQQQTMGKVLPILDSDTRQLTATDAAICAPFLEELLARSAKLPEEDSQRQLIEGYRFGAHCAETRLLMMAMEEPDYELFHLTVDMAGGARQGQITLCFPCVSEGYELADSVQETTEREGEDPLPKVSVMERTVMSLQVDLNVMLARIQMPLSALQALKPGEVLDLQVSTFDKSNIETCEGRRLSRGKLGQLDGVRAVQLEHEVSPFNAPRRRASDRPDLELPVVSGDGTGTQNPAPAPEPMQITAAIPMEVPTPMEMPAMADMPELATAPAGLDLPEMADMPDMSDLPDLSDLPDMPDMSDLPDFEVEEDLPKMSIT